MNITPNHCYLQQLQPWMYHQPACVPLKPHNQTGRQDTGKISGNDSGNIASKMCNAARLITTSRTSIAITCAPEEITTHVAHPTTATAAAISPATSPAIFRQDLWQRRAPHRRHPRGNGHALARKNQPLHRPTFTRQHSGNIPAMSPAHPYHPAPYTVLHPKGGNRFSHFRFLTHYQECS